MSSCCGATDDLANEFEKIPYGPYIIFGSIDERNYNEYAVAWTILYNLFKTKGVHRDVAMEALPLGRLRITTFDICVGRTTRKSMSSIRPKVGALS